MEYQLNFLSSTADERVKRHLKRFSFLLYLIIFGATIFILVRTHESQTYMAHVFEGLNADIEGKISSVEPRMLFLERKIGVRNRLRKESDIFLHSYGTFSNDNSSNESSIKSGG
jgi:Na+-transporting NADH:ubiquinone oxidoreductase subunit NqrB